MVERIGGTMTATNDGGSAFPLPMGHQTTEGSQGMSLRDWFAGHAPEYPNCDSVEDAAKFIGIDDAEYTRDTVGNWTLADAKYRYQWADAMLAARGAK